MNRKFEIIGEASKRLSAAAREKFPDIPWQLGEVSGHPVATGCRNGDVLIHDYDDVNLDMVWDAGQSDLPPAHREAGSLTGHPATRGVGVGPCIVIGRPAVASVVAGWGAPVVATLKSRPSQAESPAATGL